jgi:hypothetical protein
VTTASIFQQLSTNRKVFKYETEHGPIFFRALTGQQLGDYVARVDATDAEFLRFSDQHVCSWVICNEDGSPAFESTDAALTALKQIDIEVVKQIAVEIFKCSGVPPVPASPVITLSTPRNGKPN